ncbi:metal ABC transporter ATP-binding protein [Eggerthellaceae bacterium zg-997]|nr:metal ABC transporter ATP-binding protein [Eggerthellaceae bacterium zg-997]
MPDAASDVVLEVRGLSFSYEDVPVLCDLSLEARAGQLVALVGDNGAGKSTLMGLILGSLRPQAGSIRLFGDDASAHAHHADIAYVAQDAVRSYRHFPTTVRELLGVHLRHLKRRGAADELLDTVGLREHLNKALSQLSGGQLQRVGLLLALVRDARLILLDEPTAAVDARFTDELYRLLRRLADEGRTVVVITHHLAEAAPFADRAVRLRAGACAEIPPAQWKEAAL